MHPSSEIISDNERKTLRDREAVMKRNKEVSNKTVKYLRQQNKFGTDESQNGSSSSSSSSNQKVGTNLDFKLSKSNDHDSYTSP